MDVATLCTTYQKKMWKSMITRKKLPYSIWDTDPIDASIRTIIDMIEN
jgi:hypothetical protein